MKYIKLLLVFGLAGCSSVAKKEAREPVADNQSYTFGRFYQKEIAPRGGSTKGGKITFDNSKNQMFESIQKAKTKKEKDRRAILSQVGEYKVSFEFVETIGFKKNYELDKPYRSWATEYVFPIKSEDDFISLQHILVMQYKDDKGDLSDPVVVKHWRQDWSFEKNEYPVYLGHMTWKKRVLNPQAVRGSWTQEVYQVDDSPRYFGHGRWNHTDEMSVWRSEPTTRPLPRREFSVRSDYDLMQGVNTVTVTPKEWYHEQENYKVVVNKKTLRPVKTIAKEVGLNTYKRIKNYNFKPGKEYWNKTSAYWATVRGYWDTVFETKKMVRLKKEKDGKKLYKRHFEFAGMIKENKPLPVKIEDHAQKTIDTYLY